MSVFELQTGDSISAFDAGFQQETLPYGANADSADTNGPSRFSIWIPSHQVTVNMGNPMHQSVPVGLVRKHPPGTPSPPPTYTEDETKPIEVDGGFVVQTDNHVHFHTFGQPDAVYYTAPNDATEAADGYDTNTSLKYKTVAETRTVLRLGTPSTVVTAGSSYASTSTNEINTPTQIGSAYPPPYNTWNGFAMLTEGGSSQESFGNHLISSSKSDLRLAGFRTAQLSSAGDIHIGADESATSISDLVGQAGYFGAALSSSPGYSAVDADIQGGGKWIGLNKAEHGFDIGIGIVGAAWGILQAGLASYYLQHGRSPKDWMTGWKPMSFTDGLGVFGAFAAPTAAIIMAVKGEVKASLGGNVSIYGSSSFGAYGAQTATVHSGLSTSVTAIALTSLSANVITTVSSQLMMSVSGAITSVTGLKSASVTSPFGTVTVNGVKGVEVSSFGTVQVAAKDNVQLNSTDGEAYVHGSYGFYIGCGAGPAVEMILGEVESKPGPGYGIQGGVQGLTIGAMTQANIFRNPSPDKDSPNRIKIDAAQILIQHKNATITLLESSIRIGGGAEQRVLIG